MDGMLASASGKGYLSTYQKDYRAGYPGYRNARQFYAPFLLCFPDGQKWILFSSTSMRTDRIKGQQWDAYHLKKIDPAIERAYLVYADGVPEREIEGFLAQNAKYKDKEEYSAIDAIISQSRLLDLLEARATSHMEQGRQKDLRGRNFEKTLADLLSNRQNFEKWKHHSRVSEGVQYRWYEAILAKFRLSPASVKSIEATADAKVIGTLPSGGKPKTDVWVKVQREDGGTLSFSISCKRSGKKRVSVHEYTADAFADVLASEDDELRSLLRAFQQDPTLSAFGDERGQQLTEALRPYREELARWVLGGQGGDGKEHQKAGYLCILHDDEAGRGDKMDIYTLDEYIAHLAAAGVKGNFGTPFSWTYPSKRRGKAIQLKCQLLT